MVIRKANISDIAAIQQIVAYASPTQPNAQSSGFIRTVVSVDELATLIDSGQISVAEVDGQVVGALWISTPSEHLINHIQYAEVTTFVGPFVWIDLLAVAPSHRRRGIAKEMYDHLIERGGRCTLLTALYEEPLSNEASKRFHLALGFRRVGTLTKSEGEKTHVFRSGVYAKSLDSTITTTESR